VEEVGVVPRFPGKITCEMAAKCEGNGRVEALRV
jgi:hypothetical protein